jgi:thioester reductase-like protein
VREMDLLSLRLTALDDLAKLRRESAEKWRTGGYPTSAWVDEHIARRAEDEITRRIRETEL